ncbi:B12-binding domain-containing radical SAM protein [Desulforamulus aeronauticus]|uniref:Radical SAM superfamily enzyme YgiQ, UPF0313 family n=1 Tax=Desulforamulus aeronauticus DSM 10349 TaxID=1121421 RepID=A0A1M6UIB2_9FIRM|nr:radical SAM protein [Desulforamulus aeronauticus]SHK68900.1 Radical SAM superfamily enzyme YgiQ, UPF0313 family [Desulforamulus aeronauticus DSM 10349]
MEQTTMKKSILLITPENRDIHRIRRRQFNNFTQLTMPYLAGFINEDHYKITLVDEYNQRIPYHEKFDLIAITVNTPNAAHCYAISERFRESGASVILGGPHVTLLPEEAMVHCEYVIIGEAEETWPRFLEEFYNGKAQPKYSSDKPPTLEGLPLPKRGLIKNRILTKGAVIASRGCPYCCSYCNLKQIYHPKFRCRPVQEVITDIRNISSRYFVFWDDNFFGNHQYAISLMKELKSLGKKWAAQVTLKDCNDVELLKMARDSGCIYLFLGLESFSAESLSLVNKEINKIEDYQRIIGLIHQHQISVQAGIIFGFDTDDKSVFEKTLRWCEELGIDGATVSLLTPLPGTPIYEELKRKGRLLSDDWSHYNGKTSVAFKPNHMTPEELFEGYMWFRKNFYSLRSILRRLTVSKTNVFHNLLMNLGYRWSLK